MNWYFMLLIGSVLECVCLTHPTIGISVAYLKRNPKKYTL